MTEETRPAALTEAHLIYLDELRESGATNMFGATSYLEDEFQGLTYDEAGEILIYWMRTFSERHSQ